MARSGWETSDLGRVRPYALTGGRTRHEDYALELTSCLVTQAAPGGPSASHESEEILFHCGGAACSVAELAGRMGQPAPVIKVLAGDLLKAGALRLVAGHTAPSPAILQRLLDALQKY